MLVAEPARAKASPPPQLAAWTPEPHAQGQGKSGAQQYFEAADPRLPHHSLSCKFLWLYPWLQINAGWGPLSRSSLSHCSVVSTDTKRHLRWSSRALWWWKAPTHLMPQFGTSLVYVVGRGWKQAESSPVHQQVSHTRLFQERWGDCAPQTWVATGSPVEETQRGPKASYASIGQQARSSPPIPETLWGAGAAPLPLVPPWHWSAARGVVPDRLPYCRCTVCLTVMLRQVQNYGQTLQTAVTAE